MTEEPKPHTGIMTKEPETRSGTTKELAPHIGIMTNEVTSIEYRESKQLCWTVLFSLTRVKFVYIKIYYT
jgi:hypothetical protein